MDKKIKYLTKKIKISQEPNLINELEILLKEYQLDTKNVLEINDMLNELYLLKDFNISFINNILEKTAYNLILYSKELDLFNLINSDKDLNKRDITLVKYFVINNINSKKFKLIFINQLIKDFYNNKVNLTKEEIEKLLINFTESISMYFLNKDIEVVINKDNNSSTNNSIIKLPKVIVNKFIRKEMFYSFSTIFHEIVHLKQFNEVYDKHSISINNLFITKDLILNEYLSIKDPNYYYNNYCLFSFENEALLREGIEAYNYLSIIGINNELEKNNKNKIYKGNERLFLGKVTSLEDLFNSLIKENKFLLEEYPQLKIEYLVENNLVRKKSYLELLNDKNNLLKDQNKMIKSNKNIIETLDYLISLSKSHNKIKTREI